MSNKSLHAKSSRCGGEGGRVEGKKKKPVVVMFFELALEKTLNIHLNGVGMPWLQVLYKISVVTL